MTKHSLKKYCKTLPMPIAKLKEDAEIWHVKTCCSMKSQDKVFE